MAHFRSITRSRPASAQFDSMIQLVGLMNALLGFFVFAADVFGIEIPQKDSEDTPA